MKTKTRIGGMLVLATAAAMSGTPSSARSLDIPSSDWGISIGNSIHFNGLRLNFRDHGVDRINGVNLTLWSSVDDGESMITGLSAGLIPSGGDLTGVNVGLLGVGAAQTLKGVSVGLLGGGAGERVTGIAVGGLGIGAGDSLTGLMLGGLGAGAGTDVTGIAAGGLGVGAGGSVTGLLLGGLGAGAGGDLRGIGAGLLGIGIGGSVRGVVAGGLGVGAGEAIAGIAIGGLGVGAGDSITGLAIAGLGLGAGNELNGVMVAVGCIKVEEEGRQTGLAVSAFNWIKGHQNGVSIGLINHAASLHGVQIGLLNIVHDREGWSRVLPLMNASF